MQLILAVLAYFNTEKLNFQIDVFVNIFVYFCIIRLSLVLLKFCQSGMCMNIYFFSSKYSTNVYWLELPCSYWPFLFSIALQPCVGLNVELH
jgi:hypothetical protein